MTTIRAPYPCGDLTHPNDRLDFHEQDLRMLKQGVLERCQRNLATVLKDLRSIDVLTWELEDEVDRVRDRIRYMEKEYE